jgi:ssDNA-binding Zn-finger/Zn-ribbon topoisomerase 1
MDPEASSPPNDREPDDDIPLETFCPQCGQPMVLRTSKRGTNAGNQFWGCSTYPACHGTRKFITPDS